MRKQALEVFDGFFSLFFPRLCLACNVEAPPFGEEICTDCLVRLPKTIHHLEKENEFTKRLWGRIPLESGAAMYLFSKGSRTQNLIHNLKYKGKGHVGITLGNMYGRKLKRSPFFKNAQLIVPVPLHWKKERIRGFNQSARFARGLSEILQIPYLADGLKRTLHSESQTRKSREERMANVLKAFDVNRPKALERKHILIVDDVLTTGATIEACASKILELPGTKVSAVTIAMAEY